MSHLACPLCGKNAPLTSLDPENLDLDLSLISFIGLGRGKGFTISEKISILGDDTYSPMIADRIINLLKMFLNEDVINKEKLLTRLELENIILQSGKFVTKLQYELAQKKLNDIIRESNVIRRNIISLSLDLKKKEEELKTERMVEKILGLIIDRSIKINMDIEISEDKNMPYIITINEIDSEDLNWFLDLSKKLEDDIREQLKLRVKGKDLETQILLEQSLFKKKKYFSERILELEPADILEKFRII